MLLLTTVTPFTFFTALSSGLVTVISIRSIGCCPASAIIVTRGNRTSGNRNKEEIEILSPQFVDNDRIVSNGNYGLADTALVKIIGKK